MPEGADAAFAREHIARQLDRLSDRLNRSPRLGVALSGGPDSLGLLVATMHWRATYRPGAQIYALIVDHGLREASGHEARQACAQAEALGVDPVCLTWQGKKPAAGLLEKARIARLDLLAATARHLELDAVLTGHHADDQAETLLMRQAHGSFGLDGQSGILASGSWTGVPIFRPALQLSKHDLKALVDASGLQAVQDPSNLDDRFERVRARQRLHQDPALREQLLDKARSVSAVRAERDRLAADLLRRHARHCQSGVMLLDAGVLSSCEHLLARCLRACLRCVGGAIYPPTRPEVARLVAWLKAGLTADEGLQRRSLAGCLIEQRKVGVMIMREPGRQRDDNAPVAPGKPFAFDRRFWVSVPGLETEGLSCCPVRQVDQDVNAAERLMAWIDADLVLNMQALGWSERERERWVGSSHRLQTIGSSLPAITDMAGQVVAPPADLVQSDALEMVPLAIGTDWRVIVGQKLN